MPAKSVQLLPSQQSILTALGDRIRLARLRRRYSATVVAGRADISRQTLTKVEAGDPCVTMGTYLRVLAVLNLHGDLAKVALDDVVGRRLQDAALDIAPDRKRVSRQGGE